MSLTSCVCGQGKGTEQVACKRCWFRLPARLRSRIWQLYRAEQGSSEHRRVVGLGLDWLRLDLSILNTGKLAIDCGRNRYKRADYDKEIKGKTRRQTEIVVEVFAGETAAA